MLRDTPRRHFRCHRVLAGLGRAVLQLSPAHRFKLQALPALPLRGVLVAPSGTQALVFKRRPPSPIHTHVLAFPVPLSTLRRRTGSGSVMKLFLAYREKWGAAMDERDQRRVHMRTKRKTGFFFFRIRQAVRSSSAFISRVFSHADLRVGLAE